MNPSLPFGRGSYTGPDNYQSQQESFDIRREIKAKNNGEVVRSLSNAIWSNGGHLSGHTKDTLFLVRLPIFDRTFVLTEARLRIGGAQANKTLKSGLYVYSDLPEGNFRLITSTSVTFDLGTAGLITQPLKNAGYVVANHLYFMGTIIDDDVASVLSITASQSTDEATRSLVVGSLPANIPLVSTTSSYPDFLPMPSYFSANAAEIV